MSVMQDSTQWGRQEIAQWQERVHTLAKERDAVILAHNYQAPMIQDVAHHVGDSLALSRLAASSEASTVVFAGVHFMAETAKILSPQKRVLIPDQAAGCSLADTIDADQLRAWKEQFPAAAVVSYVNTTAAVKALTDVCCTSSNAVEVVRSIPEDREILFLPDQFLGAHVRRITGRTNIQVWLGECHVHADISPSNLIDAVNDNPDADLYVHPECGCTTSALWLAGTGKLPGDRTHILSTGGMLEAARRETAGKVLVATEIGMLHQLRQANPNTLFEAVNPRAACPYMKLTTAEKIEACLGDPALTTEYEVHVDEQIAAAARLAVEKMVAIGNPGGGE